MSDKPKRVKPRARPYRYYVGKGNNPDLVREVMSSRGWWEEITKEEIESGVPYNFKWKQLNYRKSELEKLGSSKGVRQCCNHFENNMELCSKAGLFRNITYFYERVLQKDVFTTIPVTFNFTSLRDPEYAQFVECYHACARVKQLIVDNQLDVDSLPSDVNLLPSECRGLPPPSELKRTAGKQGKEEEEKKLNPVAYNFRFSSRVVHPKNTRKNVWILKPGHGTNRAIGIKVFSELCELEEHLERWNGKKHPVFNWIVQKYLERPLLINDRKFDIRAYAVVTHGLDLYFYNQGYLRTSGEVYDIDNLEDRNVHLTNWAVQKKAGSYGEHQDANQMDFKQFQEFLDREHPECGVSVERDLKGKMKEQVLHTFLAGGTSFNLHNRKHCIELLGYDFMVDVDFNVCLIEVNNNPCLCTPGDATGELLPKLLQDMMTIALDPLFPSSGDPMGKNKPKLAGTDFVQLHSSDKASMEQRDKWRQQAKEQRKEREDSTNQPPARRLSSRDPKPRPAPAEEPLVQPAEPPPPPVQCRAPSEPVYSASQCKPEPGGSVARRIARLQHREGWSPPLRVLPGAKSSQLELARMDLSAACVYIDSAACSGVVSEYRHAVEVAEQHRPYKPKASYGGRRALPQAQLRSAATSYLPGILCPPSACFTAGPSFGLAQRRPPVAANQSSVTTPRRMEVASEAEEVARQLRDAGLLSEANQLERLRLELLLLPGAAGPDLTAKRNEASSLAERLRAQARRPLEPQMPNVRAGNPKSRLQLHLERGPRSGPGGLPAVNGTTVSLSPTLINIG
eukprot:TRINITY_DN13637_c0_g1_i3.p1 TRINITY_DN13637_c0_g1~~TRINITY_DN13637_c0_g1_i3.p1  ORF type:complete len:794 (+),score=228.66 TRINITY_DN13637_c0_g1_i3:118-2499(+)